MSLVGAVKAFNKVGARLLTKETSVKLEEEVFNMGGTVFSMGKKLFHGITPPKGAVTGSFVQGETQFGQKGFSIVSFFDDSGKLVQRHRFTNTSKQSKPIQSSITDYFQTDISSCNGKPTERLFRSHTRKFDLNNNEVSNSSTGLQLKYDTKGNVTGTLANATLNRQAEIVYTEAERIQSNPATKHLADRFDVTIKELVNPSQNKLYERSILYETQTGTYHPLKSKGINLSEKEQEILDADKYLPLRLHHNINCSEYIKKDAFANQGIPLDTPIEYNQIYSLGEGAHASQNGIITIDYLGSTEHLGVNNTIKNLNHESRHIWQFNQVDNLGNLTNAIERNNAMRYKYEFENYITYTQDKAGYYSQLIEKDAGQAGEIASNPYEIIFEKIKQIFPNNTSWLFKR